MRSVRDIPARSEILSALRRMGPSTVADFMRASGASPGLRRRYRQLLRGLLKEGTLELDTKGRLSVARAREEGPTGRGAVRHGGAARPFRKRHASGATPGTEPAPAPRGRRSGTERANVARFEGHREGFGFVNPTDGSRDIFIPPARTGGALHGDLVEYAVVATRSDGRREGSVMRVVRPTGGRIVGLLTSVTPRVEVTPFDHRAGGPFTLKGAAGGLEEGDAVEIEIPRGAASRGRLVSLVEVIGPITRPGVDIEVLIRKHHLRVDFPASVLRETEAHGEEVPAEELHRREDFSGTAVVTIDGDTARDFDDAIAITPISRGGYELAVHIADVAHYVRPGCATDIEARLRGTSVYFPGRAIPMLPPSLSENLCSLRPHLPRLVQSAIMTFDANGTMTGCRFADGWIRSRARLTYGRVNALLGGAPPSPEEEPLMVHLRRMSDLATLLARRRASRGGLDFDLPEPEVVLDALGAAAGVRPATRGPAQRLIEEFMIAANIAVALALEERSAPVLYRVHERPDPAKVADLARVAAALGHEFTEDVGNAEPADFRNLLDSISGKPEERPLARLLLRTMALARYAPDPLGHFGLATPDYLHFTSPIRRYPDLIAHRSLRATRGLAAESRGHGTVRGARSKRKGRAKSPGASGDGRAHPTLAGALPPSVARDLLDQIAHEDLDTLAAECSRLERTAEGAERESLAWKRAEVLLGRLGDKMNGTVSSVSTAGIFVELEEVFAEGMIPLAGLPADRYVVDGAGLVLRAERSGSVFRAGQPLRVIVARVDRIGQRVELALPRADGATVSGAGAGVGQYTRARGRKQGDGRGGHGAGTGRKRKATRPHRRK